MKRLLSLISAMSLMFFIVGCETQVEQVGGDSGKPKAEKKKEEEEKVFKIGDTVRVNDLEITITKASFTKPNQYTKPENGAVLTLEISVKNSGDTSAFVDSTEFNLYDANGSKLEEYFGYDKLPISGDINAGKKMDGQIAYDVKKEEKYELIYQPTLSFDGKEVKFEIEPEG